jgi:MerC mercury resistance protein
MGRLNRNSEMMHPDHHARTRCWSDIAGVVASCACAVHCAAMPIILTYLPAMRLSWLGDHRFHQWLAGNCALLAFAAFIPGYRRHRRLSPMLLGAAGTGLLVWAAFGMPTDCCPACEAVRTRNHLSGDNSRKTILLESECEYGSNSDRAPAGSAALEGSLSDVSGVSFANWLTPFGGGLLVVGHLINARSCVCCQVSVHRNS